MGATCASCGRESGPGRFCEGCGAPLPRTCPSCGAPASGDARFCGGCGGPLDAEQRPAAEGERRQLAVLFCDVVESTPLSQRMDAEEFGQLMLDFQQLATDDDHRPRRAASASTRATAWRPGSAGRWRTRTTRRWPCTPASTSWRASTS